MKSAVAPSREAPPALSGAPGERGWRVSVESRSPEFDDHGRIALLVVLSVDGGPGTPRALAHPGARAEWLVPLEAARLRVEVQGLGLAAELSLSPALRLDPRRPPWSRIGPVDRAVLRPEAVQRALARATATPDRLGPSDRAASSPLRPGAPSASKVGRTVAAPPPSSTLARRSDAASASRAPAVPSPRGARGSGGAR